MGIGGEWREEDGPESSPFGEGRQLLGDGSCGVCWAGGEKEATCGFG